VTVEATPVAASPLQPNHVRRRSAGGGDHPDNVILLCSVCHAWLDAPYGEPCGRLRIEALGEGRFACQVQRAVSRQAAARGEVEVLVSFQTRGRTPFVATE
jgi:hypothetical protein